MASPTSSPHSPGPQATCTISESPEATAGSERSIPTSNTVPSSIRNSNLLPTTSSAEKRLSTSSNSSRNPPTPNQPPPASPSPSFTFTASPAASPQPGKHRIPSFPPPQATRISIMSTLSSNRDSFNPQFVSSLSYTSVRDFAYPSLHPLHYGPSVASGLSTPAGSQRGSEYFENTPGGGSSWFTGGGSGYRRLSDPAHPSFDLTSASASGGWESSAARQRSTNQPPPLNFSDGPPWSEDEDLQSPVVLPKHRKHKSSAAHMQSNHTRGQSKNAVAPNTSQHFPAGGQGDEWEGDRRSAIENGISPGGDYYTTRAGRRTDLAGGEPGDEMYNHEGDGEEEYDPDDPEYNSHQYHYSDEDGHEYDDEEEGEDLYDDEDSRFSRDYQFQITSPDEEMSGKAVALFDFTSENENELPLVEGQIVWVSYRHGQGWLVAQDPRTGDTGLIPEEYVRLFRDARTSYDRMDPATMTPSSSAESGPLEGELTLDTTGAGTNGQTAPIITTFSTSSQDVYPYQFHYATGHLPENPHHPRSRNSPDFTGDMTPTITSNKERIAQLQREQERAVAEESSTPRLRGGRYDETGVESSPQQRPQENGDIGQNGVGIIPRLNGGGSDVYYDAPERQGDGFRGKANENNLQSPPSFATGLLRFWLFPLLFFSFVVFLLCMHIGESGGVVGGLRGLLSFPSNRAMGRPGRGLL